VSIIQVPPIEAIWQPSFTLPPTSARSHQQCRYPVSNGFSNIADLRSDDRLDARGQRADDGL